MLKLIIGIFVLMGSLVLVKIVRMPNSFFENQRIREELYKLKLFREEEGSKKKKIENEKDNVDQEEAN